MLAFWIHPVTTLLFVRVSLGRVEEEQVENAR
jgi:hypothetical protein